MIFEVFVIVCVEVFMFCLFRQKTAYEMRISDWSSDVCSSDLNSTILETSLCGDNKPRFFDLNCSFEEVCAAITTSPHDTLLRTIKSPEDKCTRSFTRSRC